MKELTDRAFYYTVNYKRGLFGKKVKSITISDGLNDITVGLFDWFVIYTDKPLTKPLILKD